MLVTQQKCFETKMQFLKPNVRPLNSNTTGRRVRFLDVVVQFIVYRLLYKCIVRDIQLSGRGGRLGSH